MGAATFFLLFSEPLVVYLFNREYGSAIGVTRPLGAAMALLALLQAVIFKLHARAEPISLAPLGFFVVAFLVGAGWLARSPEDVAFLLLAIVILAIAFHGKRLIAPQAGQQA